MRTLADSVETCGRAYFIGKGRGEPRPGTGTVDISPSTLIGIFDRVGLVAFAFTGVEVGMRRRLDVFGLVVLGVVTAAGGGLLRDLMVGNTPPLLLDRADYILLAAGASLMSIPLVSWRLPGLRLVHALAGAAGLGAFAAAGAVAGIDAAVPLPAVLALAAVTATGGGVIRDLLADRVPLVLRAEINATAAIVGGFVVWAFEPADREVAALAGAMVAMGLGLGGRFLGLSLPIPASDAEHDDDDGTD